MPEWVNAASIGRGGVAGLMVTGVEWRMTSLRGDCRNKKPLLLGGARGAKPLICQPRTPYTFTAVTCLTAICLSKKSPSNFLQILIAQL
jgi:hypothetical protein